jgi:hypothetical protein
VTLRALPPAAGLRYVVRFRDQTAEIPPTVPFLDVDGEPSVERVAAFAYGCYQDAQLARVQVWWLLRALVAAQSKED